MVYNNEQMVIVFTMRMYFLVYEMLSRFFRGNIMKKIFLIAAYALFVNCFNACDIQIDENRIVDVELKIRKFKNIKYTEFESEEDIFSTITVKTFDVFAESLETAFKELSELDEQFALPIYCASCYVDRNIANTTIPSKHSFGAAIDINYYMNPSFNIMNNVMIPERRNKKVVDIVKDLNESKIFASDEDRINFINLYVIQQKGSEDFFLSREVKRLGMITSFHAKIMKKYGFDGWGGYWRQPMDFMHFEVANREFIYRLLSCSKEEGDKLWAQHLARCRSSLFSEFEEEERRLCDKKKIFALDVLNGCDKNS